MGGLSGTDGITHKTPLRKDGSNLLELLSRLEMRVAGSQPLEKSQDISACGSIVIDLSLGKYIRLTATGDVTQIVFANWMNPPLVTRFTLEITNPGAHTIDLSFATWGGSAVGRLFEFISPDAGKTVFGRTII